VEKDNSVVSFNLLAQLFLEYFPHAVKRFKVILMDEKCKKLMWKRR
jgi:hypothetical protein